MGVHRPRPGVEPDTVSAIEITIRPGLLGRGLSGRMLAAMRENARGPRLGEVVAPVRPSAKHLEPATPMSEYAYRVREPDGLPADCCGCTCAGGVIEKVAPASMTVSASPAEWRSGPPFDTSRRRRAPFGSGAGALSAPSGTSPRTSSRTWVRHAL
ncbi:hypothetical protein [Streptomyces sp. KL116D]|uniref:hypothetical protein n=1 Tax=Streptomyces sp. KL116D TaxID=3045152 RepID=UPI0035592E29